VCNEAHIAPVRFLALRGVSAHQLAYTLDSLVRVSRRADETPSASISRTQFPKDSKSALQASVGTPADEAQQRPRLYRSTQPMLTSVQCFQPTTRAGMSLDAHAAAHLFPLNNFKYFLTLFSKCFSSFPHGTCSLSVSRRYLALDGIYHLLGAAFPSNPTRRQRLVRRRHAVPTGFSPSRTPLSRGLGTAATQSTRL
jgi:hypothetical protein